MVSTYLTFKTAFINLITTKNRQIDGIVKYLAPLNITEGNTFSVVLSRAVKTAMINAAGLWNDDIVVIGAYCGLITSMIYVINLLYYISRVVKKWRSLKKLETLSAKTNVSASSERDNTQERTEVMYDIPSNSTRGLNPESLVNETEMVI